MSNFAEVNVYIHHTVFNIINKIGILGILCIKFECVNLIIISIIVSFFLDFYNSNIEFGKKQ